MSELFAHAGLFLLLLGGMLLGRARCHVVHSPRDETAKIDLAYAAYTFAVVGGLALAVAFLARLRGR